MRYLRSRLVNVTAAALIALLAGQGVASAPANAATSIDCTQGTVTLTPYLADYDLVGACSTVIIEGVVNTVRLQSAEVLVVHGSQATVTASGRLSAVTVSSTQATITAASVGAIVVRGISARLTADSVGTVTVLAPSARVDVGSARRLKVTSVPGSGRFVFDRLARVTLGKRTDHNKVRVRKGSTRVTDAGRNDVVRVHRRLRAS